MGGGHWGCCCESSSSYGTFTSTSTSGLSEVSGAACACCIDGETPDEIEITLTGIVNDPLVICGTCAAYNSTYILSRVPGGLNCEYEISFAANCGPCNAPAVNPERIRAGFIIQAGVQQVCGVWACLIMNPNSDYLCWMRPLAPGQKVDCCNVHETNIKLSSRSGNCVGPFFGSMQCTNTTIGIALDPSRMAFRSLGC